MSESDYDIVSGSTATDVGEKILKIQGKGNFSGNAEKKWSLKKKNYDGIKTASAKVRYDKHMNIAVELPENPSGASYGTVRLSRAKNADGTDYPYNIFPSGQRGIEGNTLYITTEPLQPGVYADITVPVINAANYNDYEITVKLTCVDRKTVTFGGIDDNQTFVYDGTAKAPAADGLTVSDVTGQNDFLKI